MGKRLDALDLTLKLTPEEYGERLRAAQLRVRAHADELRAIRRSAIVAFEGWDAAGKGGAIRRLVEKVDPRNYVGHSIGAPTGEEKTKHYLWRFWKRLPDAGRIAIFDRTWYGRVLVERVEGFCREDDWRRAYREIDDFEQQLVRSGVVVVKLFLHIDKAEQERRFQERAADPLTAWKLTDEDWRNREKWDHYVEALEDALERTDTPHAPWTLVEGSDKLYARVKVAETVAAALEHAVASAAC